MTLSNDNLEGIQPKTSKSNLNVKGGKERRKKHTENARNRQKADEEKIRGANVIFRD